MPIDRTAKGTATAKASGTTLALNGVSVNRGDSLVVGAGGILAPITVTHAGRPLQLKRQQAGGGRVSTMWLKGEYRQPITGQVLVTWAAPTLARAMFATSFGRVQRLNKAGGRAEAVATTNPGTSKTDALVSAGAFVVGREYQIETLGDTDFTAIGAASNTVDLLFVATGVGSGTGDAREALDDEGMAVCCFVSAGPGSDHGSATARIEDDDVFGAASIGQIAGTVGAPPPSNTTVVETYLELAARKPSRADLQGATSRVWANVLAVFTPRASANRQGITPSDLVEVTELVVTGGGNPDDILFGFNIDTGEWEAFEIAAPGSPDFIRENDTGDWGAP